MRNRTSLPTEREGTDQHVLGGGVEELEVEDAAAAAAKVNVVHHAVQDLQH